MFIKKDIKTQKLSKNGVDGTSFIGYYVCADEDCILYTKRYNPENLVIYVNM